MLRNFICVYGEIIINLQVPYVHNSATMIINAKKPLIIHCLVPYVSIVSFNVHCYTLAQQGALDFIWVIKYA